MAVTSTLNVLPKFTTLMQESVAGESLYIRAKETLDAIFQDHNINSADKARIVAEVIGGMSSSITSTAMQLALQWASKEKEIEIESLKLELELDILALEKDLKETQTDKIHHESIAVQANTIRMYGTPVVFDGNVASLMDSGKVLAEIEMIYQQTANAVQELLLLQGKTRESDAVLNRTIADTVVNYGAWSYSSLSSTGFSTAPTRLGISVTPLSDVQRVIAQEQAKGYVYNAWANSVTASAGMIGTAIASDGAITNIASLVSDFSSGMNQLRTLSVPSVP